MVGRALPVLAVVLAAGAGEQQEFQLELCRQRSLHWRNNQHNYLHSALLVLLIQHFALFTPRPSCC